MLREALNRGVKLGIDALGRSGYSIESSELEYDFDGSLVLNSVIAQVDPVAVAGVLYLRQKALSYINGELFEDCLFFRDAARTRAVVFDLPGISVPVGSLLITKKRAESIRVSLAANITPDMLELATASKASPSQVANQPQHKYGAMRASELMAEYFKAKVWAPASMIEATGKCGVFVELMNNPALSEIDGVMMLRYRERLRTLPAGLYQAKRRLKTNVLAELVSEISKLVGLSRQAIYRIQKSPDEAFSCVRAWN
ncbi:MAG: hypothetical protein HHJ15_07025 [Rhodoferax sp.]|uniref:hypothetical protein n=1 Tax=Rhodoferax sp. TaxID=50421 RepID=UPI00185234FB|nr:hypothetical protein [Rhodoferax sp.]NMM19683.1 hypothetical protein [Rhodoferax sp.]